MSLKQFLEKHATITKEHGPLTAAKMASQEVGLRLCEPLAKLYSTPIWAADFDVCLVLDACRYDLWRETIGLNRQIDDYRHPDFYTTLGRHTASRWSVGSASLHWINETFADRYKSDWSGAGYVTANPFSAKEPGDLNQLHDSVYPLEDRGLGYLDEVWQDSWPMSKDMPTVDPKTLTNRAMHAYQIHDGPIVVHYMQPHVPFKTNPEWFGDWGGKEHFAEPVEDADKDVWLKMRDNEIPEGELWRAYRDNLEWVLKEVERWYEQTDAKLLVTSDHGNAKGEYGQYCHPPYSANPYLRKVPWVELEGVGDNTNLTVDVPPETTDSNVDEQLRALGYR